MDVSNIISKSRIQTNTSISQKSDTLMLQDLNIIYWDIFSKLSIKSKKYARDLYSPTAIVSWQNEYTLPKETVSETGVKRVLRVDVKYTSTSDWVKCWVYDSSPIETELTEYTDNNNPIVIQRDGSFFIYPALTDTTGDIRVEWAYLPLPLALATTSDSIKLGREYHDILIYWLNKMCFEDKQLFDKMAVYKQLYDEWVAKIISEWAMDMENGYEVTQSQIQAEWETLLP